MESPLWKNQKILYEMVHNEFITKMGKISELEKDKRQVKKGLITLDTVKKQKSMQDFRSEWKGKRCFIPSMFPKNLSSYTI